MRALFATMKPETSFMMTAWCPPKRLNLSYGFVAARDSGAFSARGKALKDFDAAAHFAALLARAERLKAEAGGALQLKTIWVHGKHPEARRYETAVATYSAADLCASLRSGTRTIGFGSAIQTPEHGTFLAAEGAGGVAIIAMEDLYRTENFTLHPELHGVITKDYDQVGYNTYADRPAQFCPFPETCTVLEVTGDDASLTASALTELLKQRPRR